MYERKRLRFGSEPLDFGLLHEHHSACRHRPVGLEAIEVGTARKRLPRACRGVPRFLEDAGFEGFVHEDRDLASQHIVWNLKPCLMEHPAQSCRLATTTVVDATTVVATYANLTAKATATAPQGKQRPLKAYATRGYLYYYQLPCKLIDL